MNAFPGKTIGLTEPDEAAALIARANFLDGAYIDRMQEDFDG